MKRSEIEGYAYIRILKPLIILERGEGGDEPLDSDEVDDLCDYLKKLINYHEGNSNEDPDEPKGEIMEKAHWEEIDFFDLPFPDRIAGDAAWEAELTEDIVAYVVNRGPNHYTMYIYDKQSRKFTGQLQGFEFGSLSDELPQMLSDIVGRYAEAFPVSKRIPVINASIRRVIKTRRITLYPWQAKNLHDQAVNRQADIFIEDTSERLSPEEFRLKYIDDTAEDDNGCTYRGIAICKNRATGEFYLMNSHQLYWTGKTWVEENSGEILFEKKEYGDIVRERESILRDVAENKGKEKTW